MKPYDPISHALSVNRRTSHVRDPKSFLEEVMRLNPGLETARR